MVEPSQEGAVEPPAAPNVPPRIRVRPPQAVGMVLLGILPVLALLGVFGTRQAETSAVSSVLELRVQYPVRLRYETLGRIEVRVRNRSERTADLVVVRFDEAYISHFARVTFTPPAKRAYEVELTGLRPGETRLISTEIQAERYWRQRGTIQARAGDDIVAVSVATTVFP